MKLLTLLFLGTWFPVASMANCFPEVNYKIEAWATSGIAKTEYDLMLDKVHAKYGPVFSRAGYRLSIHRSWSDGTVNDQAWWAGSTCNVEIFGGLARFPGISLGAVRQVVLHEIGHCVGGAPYYPGERMSAEGQADYYSTRYGCRLMGVGCKASSLNLSKTLARMGGDSLPWRPGPKLRDVTRTDVSHPEAQCRLRQYDRGTNKTGRDRCWYAP